MNLEEALVEIRKLIDQELSGFFKSKRKEAEYLDPKTVDLVDEIAAFTLRGGKRTRAFLVWLGRQTVTSDKLQVTSQNKKPEDALLKVMLAVELFQSFALIHDDIIDEDTERRGGPTVHEYFKSKGKSQKAKVKDPEHFGESMAILAGDLAFGWAAELIGETGDQAVQKLFIQMAGETILGQTLDFLREEAHKSIDKLKIDELKTALYSVARPLELGASLAGAGKELLDRLHIYGLTAGRAYQLRDNFLDREIAESIFEKGKAQYLQKVDPLTRQIKARPEAEDLLREFAWFVVNRSI